MPLREIGELPGGFFLCSSCGILPGQVINNTGIYCYGCAPFNPPNKPELQEHPEPPPQRKKR